MLRLPQCSSSGDSGSTWTRAPSEGLPPGAQQLEIDPATRRLFLLGQSYGLYVSDDLGSTRRPSASVTSSPDADSVEFLVSQISLHGYNRIPIDN